MKTKLAIILGLASSGAFAQPLPGDISPLPPVPPAGSFTPKLSAPEQGAFKALEVATQLVESRIVQKGCSPVKFNLTVDADIAGNTTAVLGNGPGPVQINVKYESWKNNFGRWYSVSGGGQLNGIAITDIKGQGSYNIGSTIQELFTTWKATGYATSGADTFRGTIIKDYRRLDPNQVVKVPGDILAVGNFFDDAGATLVSPVIDYGYQQVTKNNYVQAKYWQQSLAWRHDGINGGTYWYKTHVAGKNKCDIEVKLEGDASDSTFNQVGFVAVIGPDVGGTAKGATAGK